MRLKDTKLRAKIASSIGSALLNSPDVGLLACDTAGRILFCTRLAGRFLRRPIRELADADLSALLSSIGADTAGLQFASALIGNARLDFVVARPAGDDEWVEVGAWPTDFGMAFLLRDVTERERSERLLRQKEKRLLATNEGLRLAHAAASAASWEWRPGRSLRWLDLGAARQLVGLPAAWTEDDRLPDWRELIDIEDLPALMNGLSQLDSADETAFELHAMGVDGRRHWIQCNGRVVERTASGQPARVAGISMDITWRKEIEEALRAEIAERRQAEEHQALLIHELNHRVKNMLTIVQSMARQSLRGVSPSSRLTDFEDRLMTLAWAYEVLTTEHWASASLQEIISRTLAPHVERNSMRVALEGPDLHVTPQMAIAIAMAFHELATNATKYGSLSGPDGRVDVEWRIVGAPTQLHLTWRESGGPEVREPSRRGFGSRLIETGLARELAGTAEITFDPEGVCCEIKAPLQRALDVRLMNQADGTERSFYPSWREQPVPPAQH